MQQVINALREIRQDVQHMADTLEHYDMHKFLVTVIHGGEREELGVLAPNAGEAVGYVLDYFNFPLSQFAIICKGVA